jgi:hypothetical protein
MSGDQLPELMIVALPNDHTAGIRPGCPTPEQWLQTTMPHLVRLLTFTRSRFWENTVIFVVEDDSQRI